MAGVELCQGKGVVSRGRRGLGLADRGQVQWRMKQKRMETSNTVFASVGGNLSHLSMKSLMKLLASWE